MKGNELVNPAIMHLEKENSEIMKQLVYIAAEMNTAKARCNDMQFLLDTQAEERKKETQSKRDKNVRLQDLLLHFKEEVYIETYNKSQIFLFILLITNI